MFSAPRAEKTLVKPMFVQGRLHKTSNVLSRASSQNFGETNVSIDKNA